MSDDDFAPATTSAEDQPITTINTNDIQRDYLNTYVESLKNRITGLTHELLIQEVNQKVFEKTILHFKTQNDGLNNALKSAVQKIEEFQQTTEKNKTNASDNYKHDLGKLKRQHEERISHIETQNGNKITELENEIRRNNQEKTTLETQFGNKITELENEIRRNNKERQDSADNIINLEAQVKILQSNLIDAQNKNEILTLDIQAKDQQLIKAAADYITVQEALKASLPTKKKKGLFAKSEKIPNPVLAEKFD